MFKSIRLKLTFYFALLLAFILLGTSYLLYQNAYANQVSNIDGSLHVIINDLSSDMKEDGLKEIYEDVEEIEEEVKMGRMHIRIVSYDLLSKSESVLLKSSTTDNSVFAHYNFEKEYVSEHIFYKTFNAHRTAIQVVKSDDKIVLLIQVSVEISFKNDTIVTFVGVYFIIFFFSLFGFYFLVSKTFLPVHNVVMSVNAIEAYDYSKRVSGKNVPNEIQELVDTFNKLLVRHQASFSKISQFSSDASHELKTPLTTIRGEMEVGLRRERDVMEYQNILKKSLSKIIEIQQLIDGLLFLAKTDKLKIKSSFKELYVDEVIAECVEELALMADKKSIDIALQLLPLTVKGNSSLLKISCINLLKNAILYSPKETKIKVAIEENTSQFIILFQDQGVGIAKEDMAHIFDRFYRVDKIKSRTSGGTGLGLSIVKMILDIHDFDIVIESKEGEGTLVKILIGKT